MQSVKSKHFIPASSPPGRGLRGGSGKAKELRIIPYRSELVEKARFLRKNSTPGEIELWKGLKGRQMLGYDFDRQKPIDNFIVDFFCQNLMLAIEVDGSSHDSKKEEDKSREIKLNSLGVNIIRFTESDAKYSTESCLKEISNWVRMNPPLTPPREGKTFNFYK